MPGSRKRLPWKVPRFSLELNLKVVFVGASSAVIAYSVPWIVAGVDMVGFGFVVLGSFAAAAAAAASSAAGVLTAAVIPVPLFFRAALVMVVCAISGTWTATYWAFFFVRDFGFFATYASLIAFTCSVAYYFIGQIEARLEIPGQQGGDAEAVAQRRDGTLGG